MNTLSQKALAERLFRSTRWIRAQGYYVTWGGEMWMRLEYGNGRLFGYKFVRRIKRS